MAGTGPIFFKNANVALQIPPAGAVNVECHVRIATFQPEEAELIRYTTLCEEIGLVAVGRQYWNLELTGAQAYGDSADLARFLFENHGATAIAIVQAHGQDVAVSATAPAMRADVILVPGAYGGEEGTWLEIEVVLPCISAPSLIETWTPALMREAEGEEAAAEAA